MHTPESKVMLCCEREYIVVWWTSCEFPQRRHHILNWLLSQVRWSEEQFFWKRKGLKRAEYMMWRHTSKTKPWFNHHPYAPKIGESKFVNDVTTNVTIVSTSKWKIESAIKSYHKYIFIQSKARNQHLRAPWRAWWAFASSEAIMSCATWNEILVFGSKVPKFYLQACKSLWQIIVPPYYIQHWDGGAKVPPPHNGDWAKPIIHMLSSIGINFRTFLDGKHTQLALHMVRGY